MTVEISDWIDVPDLNPDGHEFVIGDVHGFAGPFEAVLRAMGERAAAAGQGHLTLLGDLIDKGPDHVGALKLATRPEETLGFSGKTLVAGNHDLFLLLLLDWQKQREAEIAARKDGLHRWDERSCRDIWIDGNGGLALFEELAIVNCEDTALLRRRLIDQLGETGLAQIEGMVSHRDTGNLTLTHGGPGWGVKIPHQRWFSIPVLWTGFIDGSEQHYTWARWWWTREPLNGRIIIHGHTPERIIHGERHWRPDLHRIDGQRLGLDGADWEESDRKVVGAEIEDGRYRIYSS
ncbi:hypothetical protein AiwAL_11835 [Acidiphilium sp. AL]|uniref:Calcineurin-like phosphoesterase domain-containing protein n=1 Tax=Acidiphilium iwatense TaxID=768198 RepID=A0ABS9E594_9PROT|nr:MULTISPECIES: hypothetical protein [Acidiphilium]MCF3948734.1 hypothetical protein [Acidiphilium iwatense]MCU4160793.1 hypothetical protein [Acidiphilium sp. AL]